MAAMTQLGNGLHDADHHEDALSVREAELAMLRRLGASERQYLSSQSNLANSYAELGADEAGPFRCGDVYSSVEAPRRRT